MTIRPYDISDASRIEGLLKTEGLTKDEMSFDTDVTLVYDDGTVKGFYTYRLDHEIFPHLQHFCVAREYRDVTIARRLIRDFRDRMKAKGYRTVFINAPKCVDRVGDLIRRYFKTGLHSTDKDHKFYLVRP